MHFTDQLQRTVHIPESPRRIISLVPSQTELLVDLGLVENLVGVTKFCVHPTHLRKSKTVVGGTKNYRFEVIDSLKPDLIIGNKEENDQKGIEKLAEKYPVWMSDILSLEDNYSMIEQLGLLTGKEQPAKKLVMEIKSSFSNVIPRKGTCVYLIWNHPMMCAGRNTFIHSMLGMAGFENLVKSDRYPEMNLKDLQELAPDYLLLSSEPYPFQKKHIEFFESNLPNTRVGLVDGEPFSWYGSRLRFSQAYFQSLH
jgi:ABC-type Fe3+-hydroxamate transport system substrate-binding protein